MRTLHSFHGGVHPPDHKAESNGLPIATVPMPQRLVVPLQQHIGQRAKPVVAVGDSVLKGQMIGQPEGYISCAVHAPTSGRVTAIEMRTVPHPSGLSDWCVVIEADGEDRWIERTPLDYLNMNPSELRNRLRNAGLVGLGGAVFPAFVKLNPGAEGRIPTLILNGAECEPWITCDDRLMRERADAIVAGARIMQHMLGAEEVIFGIEDNKPEAIAALRQACAGTGFEVVAVPTIYPMGGGKQLTQVLTGKETPSGGRSTDVGVQVFNVGTAYALQRVVFFGEPLISRVVTVTGNVAHPRNFEVPIGMPVSALVAAAGGAGADTDGYVMGGPMMGFRLPAPDVPVVKATNCIIALSPRLFPPPPPPMPCIRCTACAQVCPVALQPQELYWFSRAKNLGKAQEYHLFDCIECGCCNYVCPSHIPLVDYYRFAKSEIWAREREKSKADLARARHEFRNLRLEREKKERADRLAAKTQGPKTAIDPEVDAKKAAIQAAVERAKLKRAGAQPKNVDNLTPAQLKEIEEIEARRRKLQAAMQPPRDDAPDSGS